MGLTPALKELLDFIRTHVKAHGIAPSREEMRVATGRASKGHINRMIDVLVARGAIRRTGYTRRARGIEVLQAEDHHAPDCACVVCEEARYVARLKLVEALQVTPPAALIPKLVGLRPLSRTRRLEWLGLQRKSSPRQSAPKMTPAQVR